MTNSDNPFQTNFKSNSKRNSTKILCIFDGFGLNIDSPNNAISRAKMPNFRKLLKENYWTTLNADGEFVGQEAGLVGNSEVGHMNIGGLKLVPQLSFQITKSSQNAFEIDKEFAPDQLFDPTKFLQKNWQKEQIKTGNTNSNPKTIHLIGLFSTGAIHSDLRHWIGAIESSLLSGSGKIILHLMTDGRDSDKKSLVATWEKFAKMLEEEIENLKLKFQNNLQNLEKLQNWQEKVKLGSVGGRFFGMDRDQNWERVMLGLNCLFDHRNIIINSDTYFQSKYNLKPQEIRNIFSDKVDAIMNKNLDIKYPENYENLGQLDKIKEDLVFYSQKNYKEGNFDENILPVFFSGCNISKNDTVWMINFRTDRMKQFSEMFCDLNREFGLNLTILANNSYGIKLETFLDENLEFDQKLNRFKLMEDYDYQPGEYYPIFKPQKVKNTLAEIISKIPNNETDIANSLSKSANLESEPKSENQNSFKTQLHIAETEKYNHVTFFLNGGSDKKWDGEDWIVIPSNKVASHAEIPEMKAKEVTDKILEVLGNEGGKNVNQLGNFKIREMIENDIEEAKEIIMEGWRDSVFFEIGPEILRQNCERLSFPFLTDNNYQKFVCVENGQIIGYLAVGNKAQNQGTFWIGDFYIKKEFRKQGIGQFLFNHGLEFIQKNGGKEVFLYLDDANLAATRFYSKVGFVPVKKSEFEWLDKDGKVVATNPEQLMKLDLKPKNTTQYNYIIVNYANPDMVGHTGDIPASISSMEFLDEQLGRLLETVESGDHEMIIIADHGNMEFVGEYNENGKTLTDTEHNPSPVPCVFVGKGWKNVENLQNRQKTLLENLEKLRIKEFCSPDLELLSQVFAQKNQINLDNPDSWLTKEQIQKTLKPQLPLWYAGVLLLGL